MKTLEFSYNIGVNPGYGHQNEIKESLNLVGKLWQEQATKHYVPGEIYVSGVVFPSKTVYHADWGCPLGGEDTVCITGVLNPAFLKDEDKNIQPGVLTPKQHIIDKWKDSVRQIALAVGRELNQTTGYLDFSIVDFEYLKPNESHG